MKETGSQLDKTTTKKNLFDLVTEFVAWLRIVASPFLTGLIIGALIYFPMPSTSRFIIALLIVTLSLVTGILWATRIWRKRGTVHFMSRMTATSELDKNEDPE